MRILIQIIMISRYYPIMSELVDITVLPPPMNLTGM
jgi:hypothetical protein